MVSGGDLCAQKSSKIHGNVWNIGGTEVLEMRLKDTKSMPRYQLRHYNVNAYYRFSLVCRSSLYRLHCLGTSGACDMAIHKSENSSIRVVIMLLIARLARCRFSREEREAAEQGMHQYASPEYALFWIQEV